MEEELKAKKEAEIKAKERMEHEKEQREQADQLAETVWEFWEGLLGELSGGEDEGGSNVDTEGEQTPTQPVEAVTGDGDAEMQSDVVAENILDTEGSMIDEIIAEGALATV